MLVTAETPREKDAALAYLHARGVPLVRSDDLVIIGRFNSANKLLGLVAYNGFSKKTCSMHTAGEGNWVNREFLRMAFFYPFVTCGMNHIFITVAATNSRSLKFTRHLGFKTQFRIHDGWDDGVDTVVLSMSKHECPYLLAQEKEHVHSQARAA